MTLTDQDTAPTFAAAPTVENPKSWDDLPQDAEVLISDQVPAYTSMTGKVRSIRLVPGGVLAFASDRNTRLMVGTIQNRGGLIDIGTPAPFTTEIVGRDLPIDTGFDPYQFSNGILQESGTLEIYGWPKTTIAWLTSEPKAGDDFLIFTAPPLGWDHGDSLMLPDTRNVKFRSNNYQAEFATVDHVDGEKVWLVDKLSFNHLGVRDPDGALRYLPHAINRTRNVNIRSENPNGVRGHAMFRDFSKVDFHYARLHAFDRTRASDELNSTYRDKAGQIARIGTNQRGRHALYLNHLIGPAGLDAEEPQYHIEGLSLTGCVKNGIVISDSHYGMICFNTGCGIAGAGLSTEFGNESFNAITDNFMARHQGSNHAIYSRLRVDYSDGGKKDINDLRHEGSPYWLRGACNNYVMRNIGANGTADGFTFGNLATGMLRIPKSKGADTRVEGQYDLVDGETFPGLQFIDNQAYGALMFAKNVWDIGSENEKFHPGKETAETVHRNFVGWNCDGGISTRGNQITDDGLILINEGKGIGWYNKPGRMARNIKLGNAEIRGFEIGVDVPGRADFLMHLGGGNADPFTIEGGILQNVVNIDRATIFNTRSGGDPDATHYPPRRVKVTGVQFKKYKGLPLVKVRSRFMAKTSGIQVNYVIADEFTLDGIEIFYDEQRSDFIVPQTVGKQIIGCPEPGFNNAKAKARYGVCIAGRVMP